MSSETPPKPNPLTNTFSGVLKKAGLLILAGMLLAALVTFVLLGGSLNDFGANLFWAGVAIIAVGAGLDAGDFITNSPIFRTGQATAKAKARENTPTGDGDNRNAFPNLFIFILAGILMILFGTILQSIF